MAALGFETIFTIVVPGSIVLASVLLILHHFACTWQLVLMLSSFKDDDWIVGSAFLIGSVAFGGALGTLMGLLEEPVFDRVSGKKLKNRDVYECEWYTYIDALTKENDNPYIARLVMFFCFESRLALALFAACVAALICKLSLILWIALPVACAFTYSSFTAHEELAKYRNRNFGRVTGPPMPKVTQ